MRRERGTGSLYQPLGTEVWWCQYYVHGLRVRKSTGETSKDKARTFLRDEIAAVAAGRKSPRMERVTVKQIVEDKLLDKKNKADKDLADDQRRWDLHLSPFFGTYRAMEVTTDAIRRYIAYRKKSEDNPENGTINRELSLLRSAFNLGLKSSPPKVAVCPYFPMLEEAAPRSGFLTDKQYSQLAYKCSAEGLWLRTGFELSTTYSWRRGEVFNLQVLQFDPKHRTIDLDPGSTKNDEGRLVILTDTCYELVKMSCESKKPTDLIITRDGKKVGDFRKLWATLCKDVKPGLLFHDLRRTGARNMRRLGIPESVAMKIGGWKTRSVFERYNIIDERDLRDASVLLNRRQRKLVGENSHKTAIKPPQAAKAGSRQVQQVQ